MLLIGLLFAAAVAEAEMIDSVLATVNTEVILFSDVMNSIAPAVRETQLRARSAEEFDRDVQALLAAGLDQAIENKILLREATLAGLDVDDETVEKRLAEFKERFPSNEAFLEELARSGNTVGDLRSHLREQLLARHMAVAKRNALEKDVVVSEEEVGVYYESHQEEFLHPARVRCRQIFLAAGSDSRERTVARARLEELKRDIETGADFSRLATAYSEAPGADQGGLIGWVRQGDLVSALEEAAFALQEGEVSGEVETAGGFHLLRVEAKEEAGLASLDEVRAMIEPALRSQGADEQYHEWLSELRTRSRVRVFR
jgi:parvulin-like peptidyl-prolyl isomerase